jgi:CelD/BcsL family acetyltransferase involved in cellulose biosynthesis
VDDGRAETLELRPLCSLDGKNADWDDLAEQAGNIFGTPEWASTWWRHFGAGRRLLATECRSREGRLVAVLPLYLWRGRPLRVVRLIGHHAGDQLGPVCLARDRHAVAEALAAALANCDADIFLGEQTACAEDWGGLLNAKTLVREGSPIVRLEAPDWEAFLASCSRNLRSQIRTRERKLMRTHEVRYRMTASRSGLEADLDTLFALHRLRWQGKPTSFITAESFHREFAACALARDWLRLWFLEIDGVPRAAWYGFRFAGVESFYQGGRDPSWDAYSTGFLVLVHSIREALADGMSEYRFLRGEEEYKYRFATSDPGLETIGLTRGFTARAALSAALLARKSEILKAMISP